MEAEEREWASGVGRRRAMNMAGELQQSHGLSAFPLFEINIFH
jgi:hypothetical protein